MKAFISLIFIACLSITSFAGVPEYASLETKEVILKMIDAHGGMKKWATAKTFSFQNVMYSQSLGAVPFWISNVTVDKATLRVYQDWPLHQSIMAHNGKETWSVEWRVGNPPKFEALFFYYFLNLPWLTQDENVKLGEVSKIKHNAFDHEVYVVEMGFKTAPVGKTIKDSYKLFIDSETYLLVGYEYSIGYGKMLDNFQLPASTEVFGPMFRINQNFTEVDGLLYPNIMQTGNTDQTRVYGNHAIINYSLTNSFDEKRMKKPANAVIDNSSYLRGQK